MATKIKSGRSVTLDNLEEAEGSKRDTLEHDQGGILASIECIRHVLIARGSVHGQEVAEIARVEVGNKSHFPCK